MDRLNERLAVVASDLQVAGTGTSTSDVIDMKDFKRVLFILRSGTVAATGTIDVEIQEGTSTTSFNTATALASITQLTAADDDKIALLEVMDEDLTAGYRYLRAIVTRGTANSNIGLIAIAGDPHYQPASDNDLAAVKQIENA
jgi:hypothetical protein